MVWDIKQEYKVESRKIVWEVAPYLRGQGLDIGAGTFKVLPHAISVDNGHHEAFGHRINPDVKIKDAADLSVFGSQTMDFVYSSHLLEHMADPKAALLEWWRLVKVGGRMVLYVPHEDLYPKVGEPGANPDHKHNINEDKMLGWMSTTVLGWDLEVFERRDQDDEYSLLCVFKKLGAKRYIQSHQNPKPAKTACVVRYGAYGDMMMASSVWAGLKAQGYHVTVFASPPGSDVVLHDPHIDKLVLFDKDQVPNADLGPFWEYQRKRFDKWVNLCESVEGTFLAMPGRTNHNWTPMVRHKLMNQNYVEFSHDLAGLPHKPRVKFYATEDEKEWARKTSRKFGGELTVLWSMAGSSVHKTWPYLDEILASILVNFPQAHIVLAGGPECAMLEAGWENEPRVHKQCGKWTMRETMAFLDQCDLVIGPETGVLNAAAHMDVTKIVFLSHSTHENLTRDWTNVIALEAEGTKCPGRGQNEAPACHQLHYGWVHCQKDEKTGTAQCQADIPAGAVWQHVDFVMQALVDGVAPRKVA